MNVNTYNRAGQATGEQTHLPEEMFCVKVNLDLLHQVVTSQRSNRRQSTAHTKDRSERSGGGKKPWRQKGTGRARHGSIRSPLWRKGGITFGPRKERNYKKRIPKKMKRKALLMALSSKARDKELLILDNLNLKAPKTKTMNNILTALPKEQGSVLTVVPGDNRNIVLSARNLPKVEVMRAQDLNALDVLSFKYLIMLKPAIKVIKQTFRGFSN